MESLENTAFFIIIGIVNDFFIMYTRTRLMHGRRKSEMHRIETFF